jgi:hypothetical protein
METILRIPPDLLRRLFLPDLSIAVVNVEGNTQVTYCNRVTFDVTLTPGLIASPGSVPVHVRVTDKVFGVPQPVGISRYIYPEQVEQHGQASTPCQQMRISSRIGETK